MPRAAVALACSLALSGALLLLLGVLSLTGKLHTPTKGSAGDLARARRRRRRRRRGARATARSHAPPLCPARQPAASPRAASCAPVPQSLALVVLGGVAFVPGAYYTRVAVNAWRNVPGFSYDQLPDVD